MDENVSNNNENTYKPSTNNFMRLRAWNYVNYHQYAQALMAIEKFYNNKKEMA